MRVLLVYPKFSATFWGFRSILKLDGKKSAFAPTGLLTVARMMPESWDKELVDLNVHQLTNEDIRWADYVFVSAMATQSDSTKEVLLRCMQIGKSVVMGGPILQVGFDDFPSVAHFLPGGVENTLPEFLNDLEEGKAKRIYTPKAFPLLTPLPTPLWNLIDPKDYASMIVQWSGGCPHHCTFCNIAQIHGQGVPHTKTPQQFMREIAALYGAGFRGGIMFADDNFTANRKAAREMLRLLIPWQQDHDYPFELTAEVDITLADDEDLMDDMVQAGFRKVFLGLETPNNEALLECGKIQNANRDMAACVKKMQNHGLIPMSGFIVGFDADKPGTFAVRMINFIQDNGIAIAMVGVLQAWPGTDLYEKLKQQGRLRTMASGNNTDCYPNFVPNMPLEALVQGYKRIWKTIYSPEEYYNTICAFLREYNTAAKVLRKPDKAGFRAFFAAIWHIGILGGPKISYYFWAALVFALRKYPNAFAEVVALEIFGYHFHKFAKSIKNS